MPESIGRSAQGVTGRSRRLTLPRLILLASWVSFIAFVIYAESLRRFGVESLRLMRKLF